MIRLTYRNILGLVGSAVMTLGTFGMLSASLPVDPAYRQIVRYHDAEVLRPTATMLRIRKAGPAERHSATISGWQ